MREIVQTNRFKKDFAKIIASHRYNKRDFLEVIELLAYDKPLSERHRDHALINEWKDYRDCHIKPDWVLIYKKYDNILLLARTGSHSDLF